MDFLFLFLFLFTDLFGTVVGNDFRGFHLRFRDVARGGIRIVMSRNREYVSFYLFFCSVLTRECRNYSINQRMLYIFRFCECCGRF